MILSNQEETKKDGLYCTYSLQSVLLKGLGRGEEANAALKNNRGWKNLLGHN
jgi:hypothetical protein